MKKTLSVILLVWLSLSAIAQNFQFLGGLSPESNVNFATFELYKQLEKGAMYYFTDFKMDKNGYFEAYTEISKYWNVGEIGTVTLQLNVGLNKDFQIQPVYLAGVSKLWEIGGEFILSLDVLYRYQQELILDDEWNHGYQLTMIYLRDWDKFQISGYCDFWNNRYVILEPQAWWKTFNRVWVGAELRLSNYDILENYTNYVMLGIKWNLE